MEYGFDDTIPLQYLNNENVYAFCEDYHKNSINLPEKKIRLSALQRMQPQKISFRMPQKNLEKERNTLLDGAISSRRSVLINQGLQILGVTFDEDPERLFETNLHISEILDIALELKRYKLVYQQKRLRSKVAAALARKLSESVDYSELSRSVLEVDNLKDALIFCKLEDLYAQSKNAENK